MTAKAKRHRCERCGKPGRWRETTDPFCEAYQIVLCETCYLPLAFADAEAWKWFRKYRDRKLAKR